MEQIYILELKMMAIDKCSQRVSLKKNWNSKIEIMNWQNSSLKKKFEITSPWRIQIIF